ncbi:hypothetical protein CAPTEDRAFT_213402 [Capitella teleta]|uniref:Mutator-like transposase domain-containing protein n=1 Tax=Capitella teleta TaxID=283909 RepID=R7UVX1_CAPTE|nr:hypothetical protein CAPTEDRAFT_213402 [Capitella teleta]|eukprot:ELU08067.1 hypothetical protein CAPTEDRAFT_213402 [Capitella teleta]
MADVRICRVCFRRGEALFDNNVACNFLKMLMCHMMELCTKEDIAAAMVSGVIIELETGLILDANVLSTDCHGCTKAPAKDSPLLKAWEMKHKPECQINHKGSANSMRSMRCATAKSSCDGNAKTIASLNKKKVYNTEIEKEDCVNHVAKRIFKGIQTLRKNLAGTKDKIIALIRRLLIGAILNSLYV